MTFIKFTPLFLCIDHLDNVSWNNLRIILGSQNCIDRICNKKCYSNCSCTDYPCNYDNCPFNYVHTAPFNFSKLNVLKLMIFSYTVCLFLCSEFFSVMPTSLVWTIWFKILINMKQYLSNQKLGKVFFIKSLKTWKLEKLFLVLANVGVREKSNVLPWEVLIKKQPCFCLEQLKIRVIWWLAMIWYGMLSELNLHYMECAHLWHKIYLYWWIRPTFKFLL